jgi:hypothetical protein
MKYKDCKELTYHIIDLYFSSKPRLGDEKCWDYLKFTFTMIVRSGNDSQVLDCFLIFITSKAFSENELNKFKDMICNIVKDQENWKLYSILHNFCYEDKLSLF